MMKKSLFLYISLLFLAANVQAQISINELMASNVSIHADSDFDSYCDWIELYNYSDLDLQLGGWSLSDDMNKPGMWTFPEGTTLSAHSYLLVYADGRDSALHTNFKLAKEGEDLYLFDPGGGLIDALSYPNQRTDISYGRSDNEPQEEGYFDPPSPGEKNENEVLRGISPDPIFSRVSGFYGTSLAVSLSSTDPGAKIHYTTDGSTPKESSAEYTQPLEIRETTVIRAKSFGNHMLGSSILTRSYFINEDQNLPVISLATTPANLFSDEYGIYVVGTGGRTGYCTDVPHNVNQDWERPVNIELIEKNGEIGINQMAGVKIFGGCSRTRYPIKSLAFYARKEYEESAFDYQLFPDKPNDKYETFILRASADDQPYTLFRDALAQMLVKDVIDVDVQAYRPVVVYINGEYWGIHNMREKINEHYAADNFGVNPDSVDLIRRSPESEGNILAGNADHYKAMIDYLEENDITEDRHYEYMNTRMDMDEYLNYQIVQIFFGGRDWPGNNIKYWRSREEPFSRWRWVLYDLDHVFKDFSSDIMDEATKEDCECTWPNPPWSTYLFRRLLENESFKQEFLQRFSLYASTHFNRERIHQYIDDMQATLAPEIPRHIERWGGALTNLPDHGWIRPLFSSVEQWEKNVDVMRHFADTRHELAVRHVTQYMGLEGFTPFKAKVYPAGHGKLKIAGTLISEPEFSVKFSDGASLSVEGVAKPGYRFSHWVSQDLYYADSSLISQGDQWLYLVSKSTPGTDWISLDFDDQDWPEGQAELGYGDGDEATQVGYGGNPDNKNITTWFRKTISIPDTSSFLSYYLKMIRDDGARIYINGSEVLRENMQRWSLGSSATAETQVSGTDESSWISYQLNPGLFRMGENVIAVEIHQYTPTSSDISFDLELVAQSYVMGPPETIYENLMMPALKEGKNLTAFFIADTATTLYDYLHINEIVASNSTDITDEWGEYEDWIEIYNSGDTAVDLAGLFLADNESGIDSWQFPHGQSGSTTVSPEDFVLVFADNEPHQGPMHSSFKLSKSGEEVVLFQKIGDETRIIDQMSFEQQNTDISFGRFPDGGPMFEFMSQTTPGAPNYLIAGLGETEKPQQEEAVLVYPNPTDGLLYIRFNEDLASQDVRLSVKIYSMTGSVVYNSQHQSTSVISLSLAQQNPGMYMLHISGDKERFVKTILLVR